MELTKMKKKRRYLLVDDDATSNLICELNIKKIEPQATVRAFNDPEEALSCMKEYCLPDEDSFCILFLNINMPTMTGWEFLDAFNEVCPDIQKKFKIYVLTSSIEDFSEEKEVYPCVAGFLSKPLLRGKLEKIIEEIADVDVSGKMNG